jgi:hypothetical protein
LEQKNLSSGKIRSIVHLGNHSFTGTRDSELVNLMMMSRRSPVEGTAAGARPAGWGGIWQIATWRTNSGSLTVDGSGAIQVCYMLLHPSRPASSTSVARHSWQPPAPGRRPPGHSANPPVLAWSRRQLLIRMVAFLRCSHHVNLKIDAF